MRGNVLTDELVSILSRFIEIGTPTRHFLPLISIFISFSNSSIIDSSASSTYFSFFLASYPDLLIYLRQPDPNNRNALLANGYEQFYARLAPFTTPLLSMLLLCSTYLTVFVSGDRYFLICWPAIAERIRTRRMALTLVLLLFILVNLYIFPHWFEYRTESRTIKRLFPLANISLIDGEEETIAELAYTRLGSNGIYLSIYRFYLNVPITFVIPFTLLTLCNGSMIHQLLLIKRQKKRFGHRMRADIRITIMLIVIVLTFMLCRSINLFVNLLVQLSPCMNKNSLHRFNAFAHLFIAFNGFVNFFLFAAFGQRFREMVLYLFFRHGHNPFAKPIDLPSQHRPPAALVDSVRRVSRPFSTVESDVWMAIARRRSSATMAVLYNPNDRRMKLNNSFEKNIPDANKTPLNAPLMEMPDENSTPNANETNHRVTFDNPQ